jgi:pimeloyl-ACP methyl ester carboxylesterase
LQETGSRSTWATLKYRPEVTLVAHSLGCRVALETVKSIRREGGTYRGARIRALCLLAAAVPTDLCEGDRSPFTETLADCKEHVLHSTRDRVLLLAFGTGQFAYGEKGIAAGLRGAPLHRWYRTMSTGLGHSRYWSSYDVAEHVGRVLGRTGSRRLGENALLEQEAGPEERDLHERYLRSRHIRGA